MWPKIQVWFHKPYMAKVLGLLVGVCSCDRERGVPMQHEQILTNHCIERCILSCLWELSSAWLYNSPPSASTETPAVALTKWLTLTDTLSFLWAEHLIPLITLPALEGKLSQDLCNWVTYAKGYKSLPICGHTLACAFEAWLSESS